MKPKLYVTTFGEFSITYKQNKISDRMNRSKKVWTLLEYIVVNGAKPIPQEELIELLWPEGTTKDPINTLKVLMHRVRTLLEQLSFESGKRMIMHSYGAYGWNPEIPFTIDTQLFTDYCQKAEEAVEWEKRVEFLLKAIELYKGEFLKKNIGEQWVVQRGEQFSKQYASIAMEAAEFLFQQQRYEELIELSRKTIQFLPYQEEFYLYLIHSLLRTNQSREALEEYHFVSDLFFRELGITPSEKMAALYKDVIRTTKSSEMNLDVIRQRLEEETRSYGAFFCEYEFFKSIYQLEVRSMARTGQTVYIGLISVMDPDEKNMPTQKTLNRAMDNLRGTIQETLRRGDIFTRYSLNQYLVLLPTTNFETSRTVMERINKVFRRKHSNLPVVLVSSAVPLLPKHEPGKRQKKSQEGPEKPLEQE